MEHHTIESLKTTFDLRTLFNPPKGCLALKTRKLEKKKKTGEARYRKVQTRETRTAYATHSYCLSFRIAPFYLAIICLSYQPSIPFFSNGPL